MPSILEMLFNVICKNEMYTYKLIQKYIFLFIGLGVFFYYFLYILMRTLIN